MQHTGFVHLRVHSAYSLSEGAIRADAIPALAAAAHMPAVALTDSGNLFGVLEFSTACAAKGVQPIIGCQIALTRTDAARLPPDQVVLLAQTADGLANLQRLSSLGFLGTETGLKPQVSLDTLCQHAGGLILLTGGTTGLLARLLAEGKKPDAEALLDRLAEAFSDRLVVELQRHGAPTEAAIEPAQIALANAFGLPVVATNECFFAAPAMYEAHDALLCIADGRLASEKERRRVTPNHWFKTQAEMRMLFADLPDACDNTLAIAQSCAVMAEIRKPLLPVCPKVHAGHSEAETLRAMAIAGLDRRLEQAARPATEAAPYRTRLEYELDVINRMGFAGYFLIVADFIQWAKQRGIPVGPGRGSGAGSLVAWSLTITDLDPLQFDLLFERFLNPERISMPDFDIDFCQDRRDEVIDYVRGEYGAGRVAQIITFGKLQARAVVRDVGRVLGLPYGQVNKVAELIPNNPARPTTLQQALDGEEKLRDLVRDDEAIRRLIEIALQLEGLYRHASTHAAGVVIGDRDLIELVPLYKDPRSDFLVTQYSMKYVEQAGLVKFDFLGLTTLTVLQRAVNFLGRLGVSVDLDRLPLDDATTFQMLARGDAAGVFQFESAGMRDVLRQMRPDRFEDLIAAVALYRPGPMANIPAYCQRKHGEAWAAPHPDLHDILAETYGIMVYQEQVMQIAQKLGGYSLGAADLLRRAMGKKIRSEMEAQRRIFTDGAEAKGISPAKAGEIFDLMARFADYGFNKSHAAAYALVAWQTAWMKANHPAAFLAACMSLAASNTEKLAVLRQEAARLGIVVLPPDVNRSQADFSVERQDDGSLAIRYALAAIKRVGFAAMEAVVAGRGGARYASLTDFLSRVDASALNRVTLENLARAGAFDSLEPNRARLFAGAESMLRWAQASAREKQSRQVGLFALDSAVDAVRLPEVADWPSMERLGFEAEAIGFHLTSHPLDAYAAALRRLRVCPSNELTAVAAKGDTRVRLAGSVVAIKERVTKSNTQMAWVRLSDGSGSFEVTIFSDVLPRVRDLLVAGKNLLVTADLRADGETLRVTAQDVCNLDEAVAQSGKGVRISLRPDASVGQLSTLLSRESGGRGQVLLVPHIDTTRQVEIALPGGFNLTAPLFRALQAVPGVERVEQV